ncbi:MAG TPA: RNA polymerase sigma factor [bacterium]|nr:RNA polymerase sigma factor [bacterium]HPN46113.1 RNA polymerase sigma factor [bacterium]
MQTDLELVNKARLGSGAAFKELVRQHQQIVYNLAYDLTGSREDAQDLSQDVFIRAFERLDSFRGESRFSSWLYRITMNMWMNNKKRKNFQVLKMSDSLESFSDNTGKSYQPNYPDNPEVKADMAMINDHITRAMTVLSAKEKSVFVLRQFHDQGLDEIANILGISLGTVKSTLFRSLKKMQKQLSFLQSH